MKNLRMLFCMLMGLLIGSVLGIVIANLTHNQQKKKHAQMAATEVTATADATAGDEATVALMSDYLKEQEKMVWMLTAYSNK